MQDPEASVDDILSEEESSEEELGLLAVNIGSLNHTRGGSSDTEADFLDKSFDSKKEAIKRANEALQGDDEYIVPIGEVNSAIIKTFSYNS